MPVIAFFHISMRRAAASGPITANSQNFHIY
jgi:hypothetical protein